MGYSLSHLVFNTTINVGEDEAFIQVISRFIVQRLFADPRILKNKKFAYGSGKLVLTDSGREALNSHFLTYTALFCYFVETAKAASIIKHNPRMFTKNSAFKCLDDVFAELSREVLSGGGASLNRAFTKMGFKPTYKQGFADDYCYAVKSFADLTDGVIMSKLVELVTGCSPGSVMCRLRNPCGDRLRKIGNCADDERKLRRASLALAHDGLGIEYGAVGADAKGEELVLHLCRQIGFHFGIEVDQLDDLRDGRVLAGAWRLFNVHAPDIRLYPGNSLFLKVANAKLLQDERSARMSGVNGQSLLMKTYVVGPIAEDKAEMSKLNGTEGDEIRKALSDVRRKIELSRQMTSEEQEDYGRQAFLTACAVKIQ
ncbi:hypothetical protein TELCIR_08445, partial [Teladorsagia circumcincta]